MSIIILNEHIPNVNIFEYALKVPYTKINTLTSETAISSLIQNLDTQYNLTTTQTIGLVWENNYLFNDMFHSLTQEKINGSNYFDLFEYFIQQIVNINNNIIIDLITCDLNSTNIINKLTSLEQTYNVDIRYSLNGTGSYINGDWILESDNVDIKDIYFNENINNYNIILGDDLGENGSAFIGQNGLVYSAGRNLLGEIGDNTTTQRTSFTQMQNITNAIKLSSGARNKFIITSDTNIYGVGSNIYRQLGINSSANPIKLATQMKDTDGTSLLTNVSDVASGYTQTFVIKTDGSLYSCGTNKDRANRARGTLARGVTNTSTYGYIGECKYANNVNVTNAEKIMCGYYHNIMIDVCGNAWASGIDDQNAHSTLSSSPVIQTGRLGTGTFDDFNYFKEVIDASSGQQLTDIIQASCGFTHSVFLKNNGTLYFAGYSNYMFNGQIYDTATQITDISNVACVTCTNGAIIALLTNGKVLTIGRNSQGQLGDYTTIDRQTWDYYRYPDSNTILENVAIVNANTFGVFLYTNNDQLIVSGNNQYGELGLGNTTQIIQPTQNTTITSQPISLGSGLSITDVINQTQLVLSITGGGQSAVDEPTFYNVQYYIKIYANLNSNVLFDGTDQWGFELSSLSSNDGYNVEYNLPSGSLPMKMGQVNIVPTGDPTDIKGYYDVVVTINAGADGNMTSSVELEGQDTTITIEGNSTLKQQLYWTYNSPPTHDADVLSLTSNMFEASTFHASYLTNVANQFTGALIQSWNSQINQINFDSNSVIAQMAQYNGTQGQNVFVNGDKISLDQTAAYELSIVDYNGINQTIVPSTQINFIIEHDDNAPSLYNNSTNINVNP